MTPLIQRRANANAELNEAAFPFCAEEGKYGVTKDPTHAACYKRLSDELDADKTKKFPNIDRICPLPPKPMP